VTPKPVPRLETGNERYGELTELAITKLSVENECVPVGRLSESDATARSRLRVYSRRSCVSVSPVNVKEFAPETLLWTTWVVISTDIWRPTGATTTIGRLHCDTLLTLLPLVPTLSAKLYR